MIAGQGGLVAYTGINSTLELEQKMETDPQIKLLFDAMCYQIAKEIAAVSTAVDGQVDAILLTGGIAHSKTITAAITKRVSFISPVHIYPGEDELAALNAGALRVLRGEEKPQEYI